MFCPKRVELVLCIFETHTVMQEQHQQHANGLAELCAETDTISAALLADILTCLNPGDCLTGGIIVLLLDRPETNELPVSVLLTSLLPPEIASPRVDEDGCESIGGIRSPGSGAAPFVPPGAAPGDTVVVAVAPDALSLASPASAEDFFDSANSAIGCLLCLSILCKSFFSIFSAIS
eukprot:COSAG02_NODE_4480_length_5314_cov_6.582167_1_plen_176_part_10